jgi:hypothetical protein
MHPGQWKAFSDVGPKDPLSCCNYPPSLALAGKTSYSDNDFVTRRVPESARRRGIA